MYQNRSSQVDTQVGSGLNDLIIFSKLTEARYRLYRRQILQENIRWKALDEIYKIYIYASLGDLHTFAPLRPQYFSKISSTFLLIQVSSRFVTNRDCEIIVCFFRSMLMKIHQKFRFCWKNYQNQLYCRLQRQKFRE